MWQYTIPPCLWYYIGTKDKTLTREKMYNTGVTVSTNFKKYPAWDMIAEPFLIRQFSVLFTAGNSFIEGLVSDNTTNATFIEHELAQLKKDIQEELQNTNRE